MPKKTRREKIIASQRRKNRTPVLTDAKVSDLTHPNSVNPYQFKSVSVKKNDERVHENARELKVITRDLIKTLILAVIAISAEIALYLYIQIS